MAIKWSDDWNIGHTMIDEQHQEWVAILNKFEEAFLYGNYANIKAVQLETLKAVVDYADYHFKCEEELMNLSDYPDAAIHWRLHKDFGNLLHDKLRKFKEGDDILSSELLSLITKWLEKHILGLDRGLSKFIKSQRNL